MADNAFVKIGTALLKHQVKKLVGEEAMGAIGEELAEIGGDKLDAWLGDQSTLAEIEKAAGTAHDLFRDKVNDNELEQWMVSLPLGNLPKVVKALEELPNSPDETKLESALRESIALNWKGLSPAQVDNTVNAFLSALRSALLPIEKQTLLVIGRSVLRTEDKLDLLIRWFEQYIITGKTVEIKQPSPEPVDYWYLAHPYPMPPNFTGRVEERKMLVDWLNKDNENRLFILRALGGFGKSALTWHWLTHDVDSNEWKKVIFWSFYEGDASFEHFIEETLKYLKLDAPQGQRPQVDALLHSMQSQKILLIMDGFERALRAYSSMNAAYQGDEEPKLEDNQLDCVNINAETFLKSVCSLPNIKSKVLMTTRLTPRAVKPRGDFMLGCHEEELTSMQPADAVEFFRKQKIKGTHAETEAACASYGYHPLSLRILARYIVRDFHNPRDIVVAQTLKIDGDLKAQRHHVLEVAYNSLSEKGKKLLSTIACFRSSVEFKTLETIVENNETLDSNLHDLVDCGLLNFDEKNKWFDLHPIVRSYAYGRLSNSDCISIHNILINYFASLNIPNEITKLEDISSLIELCYHLAKAVKIDEAALVYVNHLHDPIYLQFNSYQLGVEILTNMFTNGEGRLPPANRYDLQVAILNRLGMLHGRLGQPSRSIFLREAGLALTLQNVEAKNLFIRLGQPGRSFLSQDELNRLTDKTSDRLNASSLYANLAQQELSIGKLKSAEENLRLSMSLVEDSNIEYARRSTLGHILSYCGMWSAAEQEFAIAGEWLEKEEQGFSASASQEDKDACFQRQALNWSYISLYFLLKCHDNFNTYNLKSAVNSAFRALELAHKDKKPIPHDLMYIHWLLGATIHAGGNLVEAEKNLAEALRICRSINAVDYESEVLLHIAMLLAHQKKYDEAKSLADEALTITERCGYVLQGADVNLFLAQYALEQEQDKAKAKAYAEEALKLATCDGPPYYYKVAYEEAERMLKELG